MGRKPSEKRLQTFLMTTRCLGRIARSVPRRGVEMSPSMTQYTGMSTGLCFRDGDRELGPFAYGADWAHAQ